MADKQSRVLRIAFLVGAVTDALAVLPMLISDSLHFPTPYRS